jgi:hypothetical protein
MRYYVLRRRTELGDTCDSCISAEKYANEQGGIIFSEYAVEKCQNAEFDGITNLFHHNCRCTLIESHDGVPLKDEIDYRIMFSGAFSHLHYSDKSAEERIKMMVNHVL